MLKHTDAFRLKPPTKFLVFFLITIWTCTVYSPSLFHVARADQISYLAEVAGKDDILSLTLGAYDLNRTRSFCPGDELLFRPIFYFILGIEKFFFRYHFIYWQLTGIVLHLLVIWILFKVLWEIHPGWSAGLLAAFFSTLSIATEMVIWHHIHGYLVAAAVIILIFYKIYLLEETPADIPQSGLLLLFLLWIGCFTFEIINITAILIFIYAVTAPKFRNYRKYSWLILCPVIAYTLLSTINLTLNNIPLSLIRVDILANFNFIEFFRNILYVNFWWLYLGIFTEQFNLILSDHSLFLIGKSLGSFLRSSHLPPSIFFILAIGAVLLYLGLWQQSFTVNCLKSKWRFIILSGSMLLLFSGVIVAGRLQYYHGGFDTYIIKRAYYTYFYWSWLLILIYQLIDFKKLRDIQHYKLLRSAAYLLLTFLILANGFIVYDSNLKQLKHDQPSRLLFSHVEQLIKKHGQDPGFSLEIFLNTPGNHPVSFLFRKNKPEKRYTLLEALYPEYFQK